MESTSNFKHFQIKVARHRSSIFQLQTVKNLARLLSKKHRLGTSFDSQHLKGSQTLVKASLEHFYHIYPSLRRQMIWEISLLLKFYFLGLFVNTWTADYKHPIPDCKKLLFPIQTQLS